MSIGSRVRSRMRRDLERVEESADLWGRLLMFLDKGKFDELREELFQRAMRARERAVEVRQSLESSCLISKVEQ